MTHLVGRPNYRHSKSDTPGHKGLPFHSISLQSFAVVAVSEPNVHTVEARRLTQASLVPPSRHPRCVLPLSTRALEPTCSFADQPDRGRSSEEARSRSAPELAGSASFNCAGFIAAASCAHATVRVQATDRTIGPKKSPTIP